MQLTLTLQLDAQLRHKVVWQNLVMNTVKSKLPNEGELHEHIGRDKSIAAGQVIYQ